LPSRQVQTLVEQVGNFLQAGSCIAYLSNVLNCVVRCDYLLFDGNWPVKNLLHAADPLLPSLAVCYFNVHPERRYFIYSSVNGVVGFCTAPFKLLFVLWADTV